MIEITLAFFSEKSGSSSDRRYRNLSSPNFREVKTAIDETNKCTTTAAAANNFVHYNSVFDKPKSLLNTSYSSEEILLQAASSLQGLEGKKKNTKKR